MTKKVTEEAFISFLEKFKPLIVKVATSYCYNPTERSDLIQDILLQLWKAFPKYKTEYQSSTWVYKIALNVSISFLRKSSSTEKIKREYKSDYDIIHWQDEVIESRLIQLNEALNSLDPYDKAVVILKLEGKPEVEAAEILGISKSNYSTRLGRIKQKLKTQLKQ